MICLSGVEAQHTGAVVGGAVHPVKVDGRPVIALQLVVAGFGGGHQLHRLLDQFLRGPLVEPQPRPEAGQVPPVQEAGAAHRLLPRPGGRVPAVVGEEGQPQRGDQDVVDLVLGVDGAGAGDDVVPAGEGLGADLFHQKAGGRPVLIPKDHRLVGQGADRPTVKEGPLRGHRRQQTHGAVGAVAFGIGTSEVEMALASQCILQQKPKSMRISIGGRLGRGVTAKDMALFLMMKLSTSGATGYFVEYAGQAVSSLSMEGRLTLCNLSIEMGARGGFIAPDETTFEYLKGREYSPKGEDWDRAVEYWKTLRSGDDAVFDRELSFDASEISPMITYGTNPGMGMPIDGTIPSDASPKALAYMGLEAGRPLLGHKVDYVFLGACTNGRIEDFRAFASLVRGRRKADGVTAWLVPGSWAVKRQIEEEGLDRVLGEAGFEVRQPGCSACLAMNDDKIPEGKYAVSTSNRNFEGRQGPGSRTLLASPLTAAAAAVTGRVTDPRELL